MKAFLFLLLLLVFQFTLVAQGSRVSPFSTLTLHLKKERKFEYPDSVWVILDRYDLTGPGILNKRYPVIDGKVLMDGVPTGKYFVDILCYGRHRKQFYSALITIKTRRKNRMSIPVKPIEYYTYGYPNIPFQKVDPTKLSILHPPQNFR